MVLSGSTVALCCGHRSIGSSAAVFVVNVLAFVLMGLQQVRWELLDRATGGTGAAGAIRRNHVALPRVFAGQRFRAAAILFCLFGPDKCIHSRLDAARVKLPTFAPSCRIVDWKRPSVGLSIKVAEIAAEGKR
jgi:hypothetical protein